MSEDKVRLMIQLEKEVADGIDDLAKRMRRAKAWMVAELLIEAAKMREKYVEWCTFRIVGLATMPQRVGQKFLGGNKPRARKAEMVYQQVFVSPGTVERVDELAETLNRTRPDMCTELVTCAFEHGAVLTQIATSDIAKAVWAAMKLPKGQQAKGNREPNERREGEAST